MGNWADPADPANFAASAWGVPPVQYYGPANSYAGQQANARPTADRALTDATVGPLMHEAAAYGEAIRWQDSQRSLRFSPSIDSRAWLLARQDVTDAAIGVIERIGCYLLAEALDSDGVPIARFLSDGQDPTRSSFEHPDTRVAPLVWRWELTDLGYADRPAQANYSGIPPEQIGQPLVPSWQDGRYGWASQEMRMQMLLRQRTRAALWLVVSGGYDSPVGPDWPAWRVSVSGMLGGYCQAWGPRNATFSTAMVRS